MTLEERVAVAIKRIDNVFAKNKNVISGHSGGKDSVVIHDLMTKATESNETRRKHWTYVVHNVKPLLGTSGDPVAALTEQWPETLNFMYTHVCREATVTFLHSSNMGEWIKSKDSITCQVDGSRLCEYTRSGKSSQFIVNGESVCRSQMTEYVENGIFGLNMAYPIFDWSDRDVFDYIVANNLKISGEYDVNGEWDSYHNGEL